VNIEERRRVFPRYINHPLFVSKAVTYATRFAVTLSTVTKVLL